jgi:hypothetical protein
MFHKNCGPEKTEKEEESTRVNQPVIKPPFPRQGTYRVACKHLIIAFEIKIGIFKLFLSIAYNRPFLIRPLGSLAPYDILIT